MDPTSVFGIVTGAMQTVQIIGSTLQGLRALQGKYADADMTIHSLIVQAVTIKAAITQLHEWATFGSGRAEHPDYLEGLDIAIDGCKASMECLLAQVSKVTGVLDGREVPDLRVMAKMRAVWDDHLMQDYQQRLQSQVLALNFLLQVCQCSIRQHGNPSTRSIAPSTISETALDVDDIIVNATAYRRVLAHSRTVSSRAPTDETGLTAAIQPQTPRSMTTDEGYASGTARSHSFRGSNTLSPPSTLFEPSTGSTPQKVQPQTQGDIGRSVSLASSSQASAKPAPPTVRRWQSNPIPLHKSGSKRERIRKVLGKLDTSSQSSLKKTSPFLSPQPFSSVSPIPEQETVPRADRRRMDISIDISSPDSATIPPIIKAAQAGSLVQVEMQIGEGADIESRHVLTGRTALAVAAHCGNEEVVDYLLQKGAKFDIQEIDGSTPLHLAASRGHTGAIQVLLSAVEDTNIKDSLGRTPFWVAAEGGHIDAARMLLAAGCKITARAKGQMTALHKAAIRGDCEMVAFLLQSGADIEAKDADMKSAFHHACENRQYTLCRTLFQYRADIEAIEVHRRTPLICAAIAGDVRTVEFLIRKKASLNSTDESGMNPLHGAAANGHVEIVQLLLEKKVSIGSTNKLGMSPLHLAVVSGQFSVVEFLLRKGAPTELKSRGGFTPLHYACDLVNIELSRHLIGCGASIEAQGEGQQRPLHIAVARNSLELVELLCQKGVEVDSADSSGTRPLCIACRNGNAPIVDHLLNRGASTFCPKTWNGAPEEHSPLTIASRAGDARIVSLLLNKGASVEQYDGMGWNPPLYAAHHGHAEVLQLLLLKSSILSKIKLGQMFSQTGFHPHLSIPQERIQVIQNLVFQEVQSVPYSNQHGQRSNIIGNLGFPRDGSGQMMGFTPIPQAFFHDPSSTLTPPILSFPTAAVELPAVPRIQLPDHEFNERGSQDNHQHQARPKSTPIGLFDTPQNTVSQNAVSQNGNEPSTSQTRQDQPYIFATGPVSQGSQTPTERAVSSTVRSDHQASNSQLHYPSDGLNAAMSSRTNTPVSSLEYSQPNTFRTQDLPLRQLRTHQWVGVSPRSSLDEIAAASTTVPATNPITNGHEPRSSELVGVDSHGDSTDREDDDGSDGDSFVSAFTAPEVPNFEDPGPLHRMQGKVIFELEG
ncbi:ankyrin repeat domain-containing protein [Arthroderma uncinatum]|uniref:ankyrin repeat domain-containing protein n=1 Tax=Arthroderma uncinatum TaxID=74035 RepID=UPI00144A9BE0|nr:ankyrin repeat domain-containing protein [Arthroderma uncinatum]KAF3482696.1 ankyrin repeat domain-containing protein [Arthroderma uncinatum]